MMQPFLLAVVLTACDTVATETPAASTSNAPAPIEGTTNLDEPTGPSQPTKPEVQRADCVLATNTLLVSCAVQLIEAGPVTLTLSAPDVPTRTFVVSEPVKDHQILAWGLVPQTTYDWSVEGLTGTITTGALPATLTPVITVQGDASVFDFDAVVRAIECGAQHRYATMIDTEGRVVWYAAIPSPLAVFGYGSFNWSEAHRTVLVASLDGFIEMDLQGNPVLELWPGIDYPEDHILHHDVARWGDYRYLLFQRPVEGYDVDGVHVFDGDQLVGTWLMDEHFQVGGGNPDWSHGNGISVSEDGLIVLSFRNFDTVVAVDGVPTSPTFLEVVWHAAGSSLDPLPNPDYVPSEGSGTVFRGQHNASLVGDDLWVFDNDSQFYARAVRLAMDHQEGTLTMTGEWSMEAGCSIQGGALPIDGGVLATCGTSGWIRAFLDDSVEPGWSMQARCGRYGFLNRGIPTRFDAE